MRRINKQSQVAAAAWKILMGIVVLLVIGLGIDQTVYMPDNALLYADDEARIYFAPPCLKESEKLRMRASTARELHEMKYQADDRCKQTGAFFEDAESLTRSLFAHLGVFRRRPRWNQDGSWNY